MNKHPANCLVDQTNVGCLLLFGDTFKTITRSDGLEKRYSGIRPCNIHFYDAVHTVRRMRC